MGFQGVGVDRKLRRGSHHFHKQKIVKDLIDIEGTKSYAPQSDRQRFWKMLGKDRGWKWMKLFVPIQVV